MAEEEKEAATVAAEGLKMLADEFADEVERRPTSAELFELLTWGAKSSGGEFFSDAHPADITLLKPQLRKGARLLETWDARDEDRSALRDLNDAAYVVASDLVGDVSTAVEEQTGEPPTLRRFCEIIVGGLRLCDEGLLSDVRPSDIVAVKADVKKQKRSSAKVGDIIAVPAKNGEHFIGVVLDKNKFGVAYGFFRGTSRIKPVGARSHPPADRHPVYSSDLHMAGGRWKVIGHDEGLLSLFPSEPELYYRKYPDDNNPAIGPYGAAENAAGRIRHVSKEEAEEVGLLSGEYRQVRLPEQVESYLNSKLERA